MSILRSQNLTRHFGGLRAVDGVDFTLKAGEIHALIGPNGAGKTTFVGLLSGRIAPQAGQIFLEGQDITTTPAHQRVGLGIGYTFQITSIFPKLSVFDNVALAVQGGRDHRLAHSRASLAAAVGSALSRAGLAGFEPQEAGALSYGHQRLLELAMGLALAPKVLILDEPTQGLAAGEVDSFAQLLRGLVPQTTILLIEHNMDLVMAVAQQITVLNFGQVLATGTVAEIQANRAVQEAYLGA